MKMEEGMDRIKAAAYAWSHTAAPMLSGTLVTIVGLMPVGFAALERRRVCRQHLLGRRLRADCLLARCGYFHALPRRQDAAQLQNGRGRPSGDVRYAKLPSPARHHQFRSAPQVPDHAAVVGIAFALSVVGMGAVKQQFFPTSDRPEVLVEVRLPEGTSIETTTAAVEKLERWLKDQPDAKIVTSYVGQGAPRFFFAMAPELPDPAFAKIVVLTSDAAGSRGLEASSAERDGGRARAGSLRARHAAGVRPLHPVPSRVSVTHGPDPAKLYEISEKALEIMRSVPDVRQANRDWGNRAPVLRFVLDQDRLNLIGLSPAEARQQLQFLLTGIAVTQVRENIRNVSVVARSAGDNRLDPARLADFSLMSRDGRPMPLDQIGHSEDPAGRTDHEAPRPHAGRHDPLGHQ